MSQNRKFESGPIALTATTTANLMNPAAASGGVNGGSAGQVIYPSIMSVSNSTNASIRIAMWKGATGANAAGTEWLFAGAATAGALNANSGVIIAANSSQQFPCGGRFITTDFLVGGASATGVTIEVFGEVGVQ